MATLVTLVGFQPIPNLLPIRHLESDHVILVHTPQTERVARNVEHLEQERGASVALLEVHAYDLEEIKSTLGSALAPEGNHVIANVTGGTKPMAFALYEMSSSHAWPLMYLQSEGRKSVLYSYLHFDGRFQLEQVAALPELITIDDYVRAHGMREYQETGFAKDKRGALFEEAVYNGLQGLVDEIVAGLSPQASLDVDLVVRRGNQVGLIEVKLGSNKRKYSLDQINTAGGQQYFGTYTKKMVVSNVSWDAATDLSALATARQIKIVSLPDYVPYDTALSTSSQRVLADAVRDWL